MPDSLIINSSPSEVRVALLENGVPVEIFIERRAERGVVGNIYRGRVVRVLPGMQAAFVEVGLERTAFLYVNDALERLPTPPEDTDLSTTGDLGARAPPAARTTDDEGRRGFRDAPLANIADVLKQGQEILVQVQKEPLGSKGARLTRHVTIPGRSLVYMPFSDHIGVSRRIEDPEERERLKGIVSPFAGKKGGYIVRTAGEGETAESLEREGKLLAQIWTDIKKRGAKGPCPRIVFEDLDLVLRVIRDLFTEKIDQVAIDSAVDYERTKDFVKSFTAEGEARIRMYDEPEPIFDHFGIEVEIERALERRVWLKSGGYIVIDQAEALTVIDVNSGRFVGKSSLEDTITQINLEAVKEIVYQLRLRNIGGIVIIDFIDMTAASNREKVLGALQEALKRDKAKTTIVRMSEIGLVEMTRKRVRESLGHVLTEACPYCKSRGFVKSEQTVANELLRAIVRSMSRDKAPTVLVNMEPSVADYLYAAETAEIEQIEQRYGTQIIPVAREGYHREHYEIVRTPGADDE
ncbi:MAG: Rne/Rng family ribonuclease [Myxococcota bacterium]